MPNDSKEHRRAGGRIMNKIMKFLIFSISIIVILNIVLTAQMNSYTPKFTLSISTEHSEVACGADIDIEILITNISETPITVAYGHHGGMPNGYQYDIRDERDVVVPKIVHQDPLYPTELPGASIIGGIEIQPGKSIAQRASISEIYNFDHSGKYTIKVSRVLPGMPAVYSNTLTITVLPAGSRSVEGTSTPTQQ
jgi:hypothetical protein